MKNYKLYPLTLSLSPEACLREVPPCGTKTGERERVRGKISVRDKFSDFNM
jgi:hypothetical protein